MDRLRSWFPDREFFMRSQGQVRFIKISSRTQMISAAIAAVLAMGWAITMISAAWTQYRAEAERLSLLEREAKVATATERVNAYREDLNVVGEDLTKRMEFLEQMTMRGWLPHAAMRVAWPGVWPANKNRKVIA